MDRPFTYASAGINYAAIIKLVGAGGAVERNSSYVTEEMAHAVGVSATYVQADGPGGCPALCRASRMGSGSPCSAAV